MTGQGCLEAAREYKRRRVAAGPAAEHLVAVLLQSVGQGLGKLGSGLCARACITWRPVRGLRAVQFAFWGTTGTFSTGCSSSPVPPVCDSKCLTAPRLPASPHLQKNTHTLTFTMLEQY